jgi:hypothetical protein
MKIFMAKLAGFGRLMRVDTSEDKIYSEHYKYEGRHSMKQPVHVTDIRPGMFSTERSSRNPKGIIRNNNEQIRQNNRFS